MAKYFFIIAILISGCYTKKRAIEKFCTQSTVDTTIIHTDTIVLDSTRIDTVFSARVDSIFVQQGKLSIRYIKVHDSVYLSGKYDVDTIVRTDTFYVQIPVTVPNCEKTIFEKAHDARWLIVVAFILGMCLMGWIKS